jgi:hypothetical protein
VLQKGAVWAGPRLADRPPRALARWEAHVPEKRTVLGLAWKAWERLPLDCTSLGAAPRRQARLEAVDKGLVLDWGLGKAVGLVSRVPVAELEGAGRAHQPTKSSRCGGAALLCARGDGACSSRRNWHCTVQRNGRQGKNAGVRRRPLGWPLLTPRRFECRRPGFGLDRFAAVRRS